MSNIHDAVPWPSRAARAEHSAARRFARLLALGLLSLLALLLLAAWAIPPMLDWGRFRTAIENIAGAELGRKVQIGGDVALRLLPEAVLTATDVTLPDRGDGISARVANLRLEVATFPLLTGRLIVRDLVLGAPVLSLPWPLPAGLLTPERPQIPHPFAAHMENGTLRIGQTAITAITAAIHGGPETALATDAGSVTSFGAAFGAEGFAAFDGQNWRFTTALGAPDADGVSAVDLALQGQGKARDTGGALQGTLADGVLQGRLHAGGPDLSLIMPASKQSWHAEAPFVASGERIVSSALNLSLGGAPAAASFTLELNAPARLDARFTASSLALDSWARLFSGRLPGFDPPAIPMRLDLGADSASLLGGTMSALSGVVLFDGAHATLENLKATLPGSAALSFSGKIFRADNGALATIGPAKLDAPDLHTTLAWLKPLAPTFLESMPGAVLRSARLTGTAQLTPGALSVDQMQGSLDGVPISGGFGATFGTQPKLSATVTFDHLAIDDWLGDSGLHPGMALAAFGKPFSRVETDLHLRAGNARWGTYGLDNVVLDAATGAAGLRISQASATVLGARLELSGTIAPDGRMSGVKGHASITDPAKTMSQLPAAWHALPGLWTGPATIALSADGPPEALALQLRADAGDLVLEAESRRDTLAGTADTTLTLRHPGAPRLLAALGYPGTEKFLDTGSLALLAHLHTAPAHLGVTDFSLQAASLNLSGHGSADFSATSVATDPAIDADIQADSLPLPSLAEIRALHLPDDVHLPAWHGRIGLSAKTISVDFAPAARNFAASLTAQGGEFLVQNIAVDIAGGHLNGALALDTTQGDPKAAIQGEWTGAAITAPLTGLPVDIDTGGADLNLDVWATGRTETGLLGSAEGQAQLVLHDAHVSGFDLARLTALLTAKSRAAPAALRGALSQGVSPGVSGEASANVDHGHAMLTGATFSSADGAVTATGTLDLPAQTMDMALAITPALPNPPHYAIRLQGGFRDAKATPDLGKPTPPAGRPPRRHKQGK